MGHASGKTVLITGASSGIGRACALRMDSAGWRVFATVRRPGDARQLQSDASEWLHPILLDVTDAARISDMSSSLDRLFAGDRLDGLVNNAGIPSGGLLEFLDPDDLRRCLEVNTIAPAAVTQALIPLLRKAAGRIVMISSESSFSSTPLVSPYSASKFALEALTDGLRLELKPWNIDVVSVQPGAIQTPIWGKARSFAESALSKYPPRASELYGALLDKMITVLRDPGGIPADSVAEVVTQRPGRQEAQSPLPGWPRRNHAPLDRTPSHLPSRQADSQPDSEVRSRQFIGRNYPSPRGRRLAVRSPRLNLQLPTPLTNLI